MIRKSPRFLRQDLYNNYIWLQEPYFCPKGMWAVVGTECWNKKQLVESYLQTKTYITS